MGFVQTVPAHLGVSAPGPGPAAKYAGSHQHSQRPHLQHEGLGTPAGCSTRRVESVQWPQLLLAETEQPGQSGGQGARPTQSRKLCAGSLGPQDTTSR